MPYCLKYLQHSLPNPSILFLSYFFNVCVSAVVYDIRSLVITVLPETIWRRIYAHEPLLSLITELKYTKNLTFSYMPSDTGR